MVYNNNIHILAKHQVININTIIPHMHRKDVTSQINPIYHVEAEWGHLTPFIVLIFQDHLAINLGELSLISMTMTWC